MAKARKSRKKEKRTFQARDALIGLVAIIVVALVIALIIWLMMPVTGQRPVPRKSRGLPQSWLNTRVKHIACNYCDDGSAFTVWRSYPSFN